MRKTPLFNRKKNAVKDIEALHREISIIIINLTRLKEMLIKEKMRCYFVFSTVRFINI